MFVGFSRWAVASSGQVGGSYTVTQERVGTPGSCRVLAQIYSRALRPPRSAVQAGIMARSTVDSTICMRVSTPQHRSPDRGSTVSRGCT